ncbi:hypothetical protein GLAREA_02258 [Glarea lozoyensis ATCC 20868]|uniref:Uncharacterized protein n=1 Tax=Glarea lozoyensis (strain ATCC 20868 / MF5171) TaxID=1116229 RepID=S3D2T3_GLAL2|nr:uncharacterized protein GLAREA_02258 [Glarea lozoyensis ATCC 20868]EPE26346.1 hypothetical protein GLAREA_02258 [Glarea lozoyensis ATCC 20868]
MLPEFRSAGRAAGRMWAGARKDSGFNQFWFLFFATASWALTLVISVGCMSPSTKDFALFSFNPQKLAHQHANTTTGREHLNVTVFPFITQKVTYLYTNATSNTTYSPAFDTAISVLPTVYRIGMSGVCRDYLVEKDYLGTNGYQDGNTRCTRNFPQSLDLAAIIQSDIEASGISDAISDALLIFFTSMRANDHASYIKASAAFTVLSLLLTPFDIAVIALLYNRRRDIYHTVAASIAIFDTVLVVIAATLWIVASFDSTELEFVTSSQSSVDTDLYPMSIGLYIFGAAAFTKLLVLPVVAIVAIIVLFFAVIIAIAVSCMIILCCLKCMEICLRPERRVVIVDLY